MWMNMYSRHNIEILELLGIGMPDLTQSRKGCLVLSQKSQDIYLVEQPMFT